MMKIKSHHLIQPVRYKRTPIPTRTLTIYLCLMRLKALLRLLFMSRDFMFFLLVVQLFYCGTIANVFVCVCLVFGHGIKCEH